MGRKAPPPNASSTRRRVDASKLGEVQETPGIRTRAQIPRSSEQLRWPGDV